MDLRGGDVCRVAHIAMSRPHRCGARRPPESSPPSPDGSSSTSDHRASRPSAGAALSRAGSVARYAAGFLAAFVALLALPLQAQRSWFPAHDDSDRIFVDIPIGLPNGREGRLCDKEARRRLGRRASTVFPPPLAAATYEDANRISREESGKGMTKQTFAILPKIREVDCLLRKSEKARHIIREVHPEICFWALAGRSPLSPKKTGAGFDERFALLEGFRPSVGEDFDRIRTEFRRGDVADDDILDAMAAAITASADPVALKTLPEHPTKDSRGLPMEMVYLADPHPRGGRHCPPRSFHRILTNR